MNICLNRGVHFDIMNFIIKIAESDQDIDSTFDVLKQLRPQLHKNNYIQLIKHLKSDYHYHLIFLQETQEVCGVAGFRVNENLVSGKHIYIDDLVTDQKHRSKGFGNAMLTWVADYAKTIGCHELHLDSGIKRHSAHRFYLRERFDIVYFHFKKMIAQI
jgi:GNAT superfamily N-acetyltransferase